MSLSFIGPLGAQPTPLLPCVLEQVILKGQQVKKNLSVSETTNNVVPLALNFFDLI